MLTEAAGIYEELKPLLSRLPSSDPVRTDRDLAIKKFDEIETNLCETKPGLKYSILIEEAYVNFAESLSLPKPADSEIQSVGASIGKWPAFPDTIKALQRLHKYYKLVILSNVDKESFDRVLKGPFQDIKFDAVYVAEEIGSYKPDLKNFHYLVDHVKTDLDVNKGQILHTAHGLRADHVPSKQMGMTSAWIARGEKGGPGSTLERLKDKMAYTWQYESMGEMADDADRVFENKQ